jgi:hypothetical protein
MKFSGNTDWCDVEIHVTRTAKVFFPDMFPMLPYSVLKYLAGPKARNILVFLSEVSEEWKIKIKNKY